MKIYMIGPKTGAGPPPLYHSAQPLSYTCELWEGVGRERRPAGYERRPVLCDLCHTAPVHWARRRGFFQESFCNQCIQQDEEWKKLHADGLIQGHEWEA